jgi:putative addiction module component (TIGR02574 family)
MSTSLRDIEAAALELPEEERAQLAHRLYASLDRDAEVEAAWAAEIRRRVADLEAGLVETIPAEQVLAEVRRRFSEEDSR